MTINRENEINVIAYQLENNDIILGKSNDGGFYVKTSDGIFCYSPNEMEEIYGLDINSSDLERLTWTS